jgi:predicted nucleic acid-binding protein
VTGNKALFDSNIIIYLAKREMPLSILDQFDDICISVITYMEILGFSFADQEQETYIRELISFFTIIYVDQKIADIVVDMRKKKKIKLPDAIISATAISLDLQLVTRNIVDFDNINVKILNPFE